jgi:phosphohistidine phosphatase
MMSGEYHVSIMRHAKSDWDVGGRADFERPLAPRGERDAGRMAKWLSTQAFVPEQIISSTAVRAVQTARIVAAALGGIPITCSDRLYLAELDILVETLAQPPAQNWMLVGHNPGLEDLVEFCDPHVRTRSGFVKLMPTAAIYAVALDPATMPLKRGCGRIIAHQRPKQLV